MGQVPLAILLEKGQRFAAPEAGDTELAGRYTLSLFLQGRESKTERSFPYVSVSSATKYKMLNIIVPAASKTVNQSGGRRFLSQSSSQYTRKGRGTTNSQHM